MPKNTEYFKEYYERNKDQKIKAAIEYQQQHSNERKEYMRRYYRENKSKWPGRTRDQRDRYNATRREQYKTNEQYREKQKCLARSRTQEQRRGQLMSQYGLTNNDYARMLQEQNGKCAICGSESGDKTRKHLYVDHCHKSGIVRGLLCCNCNHMLGKVKDDIEILKKAISYLGRFK